MSEQREPTPHWRRRWPHDQPDGWNLNAAKLLRLVQLNPLMWLALGRAKYLELRVDTRDGGFNLYDRDKKPLNPDDVIEAINKVRKDFGEASLSPDASDLEQRLRAKANDLYKTNGEAMKLWDKIRATVETSKGSDLPRLMFEGFLEEIAELLIEAAEVTPTSVGDVRVPGAVDK